MFVILKTMFPFIKLFKISVWYLSESSLSNQCCFFFVCVCTGYSSRHLLQAAWQGNVHLVKKLLVSNPMELVCKWNFEIIVGFTF